MPFPKKVGFVCSCGNLPAQLMYRNQVIVFFLKSKREPGESHVPLEPKVTQQNLRNHLNKTQQDFFWTTPLYYSCFVSSLKMLADEMGKSISDPAELTDSGGGQSSEVGILGGSRKCQKLSRGRRLFLLCICCCFQRVFCFKALFGKNYIPQLNNIFEKVSNHQLTISCVCVVFFCSLFLFAFCLALLSWLFFDVSLFWLSGSFCVFVPLNDEFLALGHVL